MPWNNSGMASGAAQGAATGASFGPMGAVIGGVGGAVIGGLSGQQEGPGAPPTLPAIGYPGAVSTPYGSMIYNPITGSTNFVNGGNQTFDPTSYQNQLLYDQLMGSGGTTSQTLADQIQKLQLQLQQTQSAAGNAPTYADFGDKIVIDPKTGEPVNYQNYINVRGAANPLWDRFMRETGGNYGSKNQDISFGKWAKDWTNRYQTPAVEQFQKAQQAYEANKTATGNNAQQIELQLKQLQGLQEQGGSSGASSNPILQAINQQQAMANDPSYLRAMNAQTQEGYDNALNQQDQALAARGLGSSGLAEITKARMGLQLNNARNQNQLAANQQSTALNQNAFNNRMNMLNFLAGRSDTAFGKGMQQQGLGLQQMGLGYQVGNNQQNLQNQNNLAQVGLATQYNLANTAARNLNTQNTNNQWASALGTLGYGLGNGSIDWSSPTTTAHVTGMNFDPASSMGSLPTSGGSVPSWMNTGPINPVTGKPY